MSESRLRPELPPLPLNMSQLQVDERGYPVPAFVQWIDGKPDFRVANAQFREYALANDVCFVCGRHFTNRRRWYVLGPMCVINRNTSEPACHYECAVYSAKACPFLVRPHAKRREAGRPEGVVEPVGMIKRNPAVVALYHARTRTVHRTSPWQGEYLLGLGEPLEVEWIAEGQPANREQVLESILGGFHLLVEAAKQDGEAGLRELFYMTGQAYPLLPREPHSPRSNLILVRLGEMVGEAVNELKPA